MKKLLFFLSVSLLAVGANAQDVKFGVKGGLNVANITGSDISLDSRISLHLGVTSEISLTDKFSLQPELLYSAQGSDIGDLITIELDYLSLPILAKYYIADGFSVEAGPQFSFLVNDNVSFDDGLGGQTVDIDANSFDLGASLGLGYKFDMGIFTQARYTIGITALDENPDIRNGNFQLSVGYQF
ncbi:outer membrane beta-barrel protein [Leptobacterium flavescens]|uniref:Outer membrane beta-barrel protein n=1 Tax=Leptobacterium flavescens TaxID=472055 RepID=A0A6P0UVY4_9FLAO|nr:porin family protein [Leptobacterium flavescens]NER14586.1 outer membrane beta-barrel protein [Leptobacterium flavescens]